MFLLILWMAPCTLDRMTSLLVDIIALGVSITTYFTALAAAGGGEIVKQWEEGAERNEMPITNYCNYQGGVREISMGQHFWTGNQMSYNGATMRF